VKEDEMSWANSRHRREEKYLQGYGEKGTRNETTRKT
jgi:hypothetical protein